MRKWRWSMRAAVAPGAWAVMALVAACGGDRRGAEASAAAAVPDPYVDPPAVRTFPTSAARIDGWVAAAQLDSVRGHGWDLWESITSPADSSGPEPVWQTWYSGHELFEVDSASHAKALAAAAAEPGRLAIPRHPVAFRLETPRQTKHHLLTTSGRIPISLAERVFSFNRFSRSTAQVIYGRRLWDWTVMRTINEGFNARHAPVAARQVLVSRDSTDPMSVVLKPVFQLISGDSASCIPYWAGDTPAVTDSAGMNPVAIEWKQFVIVDPTGRYRSPRAPGAGLANCPPVPGATYPVVPLSRFYWRRLTAETAAAFSTFAAENGDDIGKMDSTTLSAMQAMIKPGNIGLLVAMHVTGKETVNWTWQTFWWSPTPNDSLGADRPATIRAPWDNYQMQVAYWMTNPPAAKARGKGNIAFNPYLETSLGGVIDTNGVRNRPWYGPQTNCMSCHRMAAWKDTTYHQGTDSAAYGPANPPYVPASWVDAGNATFLQGYTKTDFLWSVAIRTRGIPTVPPRATAGSR